MKIRHRLGFVLVAFSFWVAVHARAAESLIVTTTVDENNGTSDPTVGTGTSLREAVIRANTDGVNSTITFNPTVFAAPRKTITLGGTALPNLLNNGTLSITAPAAGVEISGNNASRMFTVNPAASVTLMGLTFRNGVHGSFGGAIYNNNAGLRLDSCTLSNNSAGLGGAIYSDADFVGQTLTLLNCTFSGNSGELGGGALYNADGLAIIDSCTIAGNTAPAGPGGGVASIGDTGPSGTRTEVRNSIISGNTNTDVDFTQGNLDNSFQSNGYNLIGDGNATGEFVETGDVTGNSNPGLAALADFGGPTQTRALMPTSPALNTGNTTLTVDQRGMARPQSGVDDKGAFEAVPDPTGAAALVVTTTVDAIAVDGLISLREAIITANSDGVNSAITFNATVFAAPRKTITLGGTQFQTLAGDGTLSITAPAAGVEISGNNASRMFSTAITSNVTLTGLIIRDGNAGANSGGALTNSGTLLLDSCTLTDNIAGGGGAIRNDSNMTGRTLTLRNCTLSDNTATSIGGAIYNFQGLTVIESSTIADNTAPANQGSGVTTQGETFARTEVQNSVISGNTNTDVDFVQGPTNSFQSNGYNLIGDGNATGDFNQTGDVTGNGDPGLFSLAENGGRTPTMELLTSSPALNTGNTPLTTDQRGVARPQLGQDDKGAYELLEPFTVSRKVHGATPFDVVDPLVSPPAIECRSGGATNDFEIVTAFPSPVTVNGNPQAQVTSGTGTVGTGGVSNGGVVTVNGAEVTIPLTNVANAQTITITLFAVNHGTGPHNVSIQFSFLLSDTTGNGSVNATDVSLTKLKSGQAVDATNFRTDVTVSNSINATDVSSVKLKSGTALP